MLEAIIAGLAIPASPQDSPMLRKAQSPLPAGLGPWNPAVLAAATGSLPKGGGCHL